MDAERVSTDSAGVMPSPQGESIPPPPRSATAARITSVRWGQTVNLGNYESARLDVEAAVFMDGSAESTLEGISAWVRDHLPLSDSARSDLHYERRQQEAEMRELTEKLEAARAQWGVVKKFMEYVGIDIPPRVLEDLPF